MKKNIYFSVLMIMSMLLCLYSCDNQQNPQKDVEEPISIEMLKNRKILVETRIFTGGCDTTEYTYDIRKRLIKKKLKQYYYDDNGVINSIIIREDTYTYNGESVTNTIYNANFYYKNGEKQENRTKEDSYVYSITTYTDSTFTHIKSITRERNMKAKWVNIVDELRGVWIAGTMQGEYRGMVNTELFAVSLN